MMGQINYAKGDLFIMLNHSHAQEKAPKRVVLLGAGGFVGKAAVAKMSARGFAVLGLTRQDIDLCQPQAVPQLAEVLRDGDCLVVVAAKAPCKNAEMLVANTIMMNNIIAAATDKALDHVVYISSDAVYADSDKPMTEESPKAPDSLHGVMHLARELMLGSVWQDRLAILRPTLLYGAQDPHNGYGPNQFRRLAAKGEPIKLFGNGEERRDHVYIDDVAELIARVVARRSTGTLNLVSGVVTSFRDIAAEVAARSPQPTEILTTPRRGPMPHNGYRAFTTAACQTAFPDFTYTALKAGLEKSCEN